MRRSLIVCVALAVLGCLPARLAFAAGEGKDDDAFVHVLLRPAGWSAEWRGPGGSGRTDVIFVPQGNGFLAKIRLITPFELSCENPAVVEANRVTFDGCRDPQVTLTYDPNDSATPLRGGSPRGYEWVVRPR
jgi:hypothetical protein